jgi:opacity protein-like surface antigen
MSMSHGETSVTQRGTVSSILLTLVAVMARDLSAAQKTLVFDFGVRGGVLPGQPLESNPYSGRHNFLPTLTVDNAYGTAVGPTFVLQLVDKVDVRFEWVYKRFSYQLQSTLPPIAGSSSFSSVKGYSWEYPLLATYKFGNGKIRPFAGGGMNLGGITTSSSTNQSTVATTSPPVTTITENKTSKSLPDAYHIVGGLEWRFPVFSVRPEFRYTHWSADKVSGSFVSNKPNQFEVIVGFTLHPFQGQ